MIDITRDVQKIIKESGVNDGICIVYVPHTTAGLTINEGADPDVCRDILNQLEKIAPENSKYFHTEGNADAHIKSSLVGCSKIINIKNGGLLLGTWQAIFFCEFDGPRNREVYVKII